MANKIIYYIKDVWEDFRYMNEGSSPKYWVNQIIWYIWFTFFIITMFIAATLGEIIYDIQKKWYKFKYKL